VVDTNVILDIYTCGDLYDEYMRAAPGDLDNPATIYRRARARESLVLAIHLHETGASTLSLPNESLNHMVRVADPKKLDDPKVHFTWLFVNFIKDRTLSNWNPVFFNPGDHGLTGNRADDYIVQIAKDNTVPLISNEGFSPQGVDDLHGIRGKARATGADVKTPREYWEGKVNPKRASRRFIADFRNAVPRIIRRVPNAAVVAKALSWIDGYFQHIFFGIAADRVSRLRVEV
jgi:hypothetical protein